MWSTVGYECGACGERARARRSLSLALARDASSDHINMATYAALHDTAARSAAHSDGEDTPTALRYGHSMPADSRLKDIMNREDYFLHVLLSKHLTYRTIGQMAWVTIKSPHRLAFLAFLAGMYVTVMAICSAPGDGGDSMCSGGPSPAHESLRDERPILSFSDYRPAIMNSLATLLLAFYCNVAVSNYRDTYFACLALKHSVLDLTRLATGTMIDKPHAREVLLDIWRCANIVHACAYALADRGRVTYSFNNFVLPVCESFGAHDGRDRIGMFRQSELDRLRAMNAPEWGRGVPALRAMPPVARSLGRGRPSAVVTELTNVQPAEPARGLGLESHPSVGDVGDGADAADSLDMPDFTSRQAYVRSLASDASQLYATRLFAVVQRAAADGLTKAAWPVWGGSLNRLCHAASYLEQRGLYRLPAIYRASVQCIVSLTIACDVFIMGTVVGRLFQSAYGFAWFDAILASVATFAMVTVVFLLVNGCADMELPLGSDPMDLPGLSYVAGAADMTLRVIAPKDTRAAATATILTSDVDALFDHVAAIKRKASEQQPAH